MCNVHLHPEDLPRETPAQTPLHNEEKGEKMAIFVIFAYLQYWFKTPSLHSAASNDLLQYKYLLKFAKVGKTVSKQAATTLQCHPWYLT